MRFDFLEIVCIGQATADQKDDVIVNKRYQRVASLDQPVLKRGRMSGNKIETFIHINVHLN